MFNVIVATLSLQAARSALSDLESDLNSLNDLSTMPEPAVDLTPNMLQEGGSGDNVYKKPELSVVVRCGGTDDEPFYGSKAKVEAGFMCCDAENDKWSERDEDCPGPKAEVHPISAANCGKPEWNKYVDASTKWQADEDAACGSKPEKEQDSCWLGEFQKFSRLIQKVYMIPENEAKCTGSNVYACKYDCTNAYRVFSKEYKRYEHARSIEKGNHPQHWDNFFKADSGTYCVKSMPGWIKKCEDTGMTMPEDWVEKVQALSD